MRPTDEQVREALAVLAPLAADSPDAVIALKRLERAAKHRPVWGSMEVANYLGVLSQNLRPGSMRGFSDLPAPCQELPRPTKADPGKTFRLWYADQVQAVKAKWDREGGPK